MFGFEKKKKSTRKPYQPRKDPETKLRRIAQKKLVERFTSGGMSPSEEREVFKKTTGYDLQPSADDDSEIRDLALRTIREDPEMRKQAVAAYIDSMKSKYGPESSPDGDAYNGSSGLENMVDSMAMEAIQNNPKLVEGAVKARITEMFGGCNGDSDPKDILRPTIE